MVTISITIILTKWKYLDENNDQRSTNEWATFKIYQNERGANGNTHKLLSYSQKNCAMYWGMLKIKLLNQFVVNCASNNDQFHQTCEEIFGKLMHTIKNPKKWRCSKVESPFFSPVSYINEPWNMFQCGV